ncbi:MAG TPA: serine hydrolase [Telluria sp.]|nr:serine hydrolase [Telluria sp.]
MSQLPSICLAALLVLPASFSAAAAKPAPLAAQIDASIAPYFNPADPGATVIVTKDGKPLFRKAYGMADVAGHRPLTPDMSLRLGSITKQFTAVAILMLADEDKLALDDDIRRFLPDYPTQGKSITIEHLLTHTSGIVDYTTKRGFSLELTKDKSIVQMIDTFKDEPLEFEPGTRWKYDSSGYFLLGAIIEKVSGKPYAKFIEERIFVPLGMRQTAYEGYERSPVHRAAGYMRSADAYVPNAPLSMSQPYSAGGLVSTVDDLARWDAAISAGKLLKPASWKRAFTPYKLADGSSTGYGYGWELGTLRGLPVIAHGGRINGYLTYAMRMPEQKLFVAVLENADSGLVYPESVARKAAAIAIGKPFAEHKTIPLDAKALEVLTGEYKIDAANSYTIRVHQGELMLQRTGRPARRLLAYSPYDFMLEQTLTTAEFKRDGKGEITQLAFEDNGKTTVYPRIGAARAARIAIAIPNALFDTYVGRYEVAPGQAIAVSREGDRFFAQVPNAPKLEMFAMTETVFFSNQVDAELRFVKNADGSVQHAVLHQQGRDIPVTRVAN